MNFKTSYLVFKLCLKLKEIYISKKFKNMNKNKSTKILINLNIFLNLKIEKCTF